MTKMNSLERVATAIQLKEPDRVPVIPVMMIRALKEIGAAATHEVLHNPATMSQAKLTAFKKYGGDALIAGTGLNVEAEALGCTFEYQEEEIPVIEERVLQHDPDLNRLGRIDINSGRVMSVAKEVETLNNEHGSSAVVGVCISGPFTTALELRGLAGAMTDMKEDPDYFKALMEKSTQEIIRYSDILIDHGALALNMLEPLCSCDVIPPDMYSNWALPYQQKIFNHIKSKGRVPIIHVCTYSQPIWDTLPETGALAFHGDIQPSLGACKAGIGGKICLIGNVNPIDVLLYGTADDVKAASERCIKNAGAKGGFVLAAGCDTGYDVPDENLHAMVETAKGYSYPLNQ